jgi:hypothetical protein
MSRLLGEGRPKPPSLLDTMSNSSMEYSIMAHHRDNGLNPVHQEEGCLPRGSTG